ncbi:MAG: YbjN domain-containing protein [Rhizobiales bacterium]|nr:YbjN domain-containing protein [Hyphomicrobiales bacterium]
MSLADLYYEDRHSNPVDVIETVAALNDWLFEREGDDEITISISGGFAEYHVSFSWMNNLESLHLACAFDLKVKQGRMDEVVRLLALVNEQMMCGHFDLWSKEGIVIYRQSLMLTGGVEPTTRQVEGMFHTALDACERYFQAFQFVVWAGRDAKDALACVLFETEGEA